MKKTLFLMILSLILNSVITFGQSNDYRNGNSTDNMTGKPYKTSDFITEIKKYDMSDFWAVNDNLIDSFSMAGNEPLGFIGENYQRFFIHITSAIQNPANHLEYYIYGKTKVKDFVRSFQGLITITEAKIYIKNELPQQEQKYIEKSPNEITLGTPTLGGDDDLKDYVPSKQGYVIGKYEFFEDSDQKETGILKGNFLSDFYVDSIGRLEYDDLLAFADGYFNNQFSGSWMDYKTSKTLKCNWGDFRIPESDSLDNGNGVTIFLPSNKFEKFGWDNYIRAYNYEGITTGADGNSIISPDKIAAQIKEQEKWWLDK